MKIIKHILYSNKNFHWLAAFLVCAVAGLSWFIFSTTTADVIENELRAKISGIYSVINDIVPATADMENVELPAEYDLLLEEERLLNREYSMRIMENYRQLVNVRQELLANETQLSAHQQENPDLYATDFLYDPLTVAQDTAKYDQFAQSNRAFDPAVDDQVTLFKRTLSGLLSFSLLLLAIFNASLLLSLRSLHGLGYNLPVIPDRLFTRILLNRLAKGAGLHLLALALLSAIFLSGTQGRLLTYPTPIFYQGNFLTLPLLGYVALLIGGSLLSVVLLTLVQVVLNLFVRNQYVTLLSGCFWLLLSYATFSSNYFTVFSSLLRFDRVLAGSAGLSLLAWLLVIVLLIASCAGLFIAGIYRRQKQMKGIIL